MFKKNRLAIAAIAAIAILLAGACRSPVETSATRADFTLSFIISGRSLVARDPVADSGDKARLLLPTARTLTVTLVPDVESVDSRMTTKTVSLDGTAGTALVPFTDITLGQYTVKADATDAAGVVLFTQTSPLTVAEASASATLNLVPTNPAGLPSLAEETATFDLEAASSVTYVVPVGSPFFAGTRGLVSAGGANISFYVQGMDGRSIESGPVSAPGVANSIPTDADLYFTLYNEEPYRLTGISYQVAHSVTYVPGTATGGIAPIDSTAYLAGSQLSVKYSTGNIQGAPIRDGITERLDWNTLSDGTGTTYAYGQIISMGSENVTLYPKWTTTAAPATDPVLGKIGPAGGVVFYENPSYITDGWRYLEAAPTNQAYIHDDPNSIVPWSNVTDASVSTTGTAIGTGKANTAAMVGQAGYSSASPNAASVCDGLSIINDGTTFDDWFLPSSDELQVIAANVVALNLNGSGTHKMDWDYWSSSEISPTDANGYYVNCYSPWNNTLNMRTKSMSLNVRAVRSF